MSDASRFVEIDWAGRRIRIEHRWIAGERLDRPLIVIGR